MLQLPKFRDIVGQNKNVLSAKRTIHIKDARIEKQENPSVLIVRGHMLHLTKGIHIFAE